MLNNGRGAFDIQACSRTGIPAGKYNVMYGAVGDVRSPVALYRGRGGALSYEIQPDKRNMLRIGPPLQLVFRGEYKQQEKQANKNNKNKSKSKTKTKTSSKYMVRTIRIWAPTRLIGVVGEEYGPVSFPNARSSQGRPAVMVLQGSRTIARGTMTEHNGRVGDFYCELPRKASPLGIRVAVAAPIRGLGKIVSARTLKQIVNNEEVTPPKTDKPMVATTPWKKPARKSPRTAVKPKPPIGDKPKPAPTTRPAAVAPKPKPKPTNEQKAAGLLKLAKSYERMRLRAKYVEMLKKTMKKYPGTTAALTAKELLAAEQ